MSRLTKIMVALLASTAIAAPAFAITGDVSGFLHVRGVAADNMDGRDKDGQKPANGDSGLYDDNTRAVDERLRLFTTAALNENVKAVFTVEVDYVWGDTGVGKLGADQKGEIEIANLYLDFNMPEANTNVKAGTHYFKTGGGLILAEHAAGVSTRTAFGENLNLGLYWVKQVEGVRSTFTGADRDGDGDEDTFTTALDYGDEDDNYDVDYYHAQLDIKAGDMTVTPFVAYYDVDDATALWRAKRPGNPSSSENEQFYYGLELKGKAAALEYSAAAFYNDGRINGANNDAFAFLANAGYTMADTKLIAEVARYGDSDTYTGQIVNVMGYNNFAEVITGGNFDKRTTSGGTAQTASGYANAAYAMNFQYVKLGMEQKVHEKGKIRGYYIYAEEAADVDPTYAAAARGGQKRITFGHELDLYYDYTVVPGLVATLGGGYLLADDDFGYAVVNGKTIGGDDAWKAGLGLAYKF